jgi:hypothetical protein
MKRGGQVTIFVIVAVILVSVAVLFFIFRNNLSPKIGGSEEVNPSTFMQVCMDSKIQETLETLGNQGGFMENSLYKKFKFSDETEYSNISLLCYTNQFYVPCINQKPMYISQVRDEVKKELSQDMSDCFNSLTLSLQKKYESVDAEYHDFEVVFEE